MGSLTNTMPPTRTSTHTMTAWSPPATHTALIQDTQLPGSTRTPASTAQPLAATRTWARHTMEHSQSRTHSAMAMDIIPSQATELGTTSPLVQASQPRTARDTV